MSPQVPAVPSGRIVEILQTLTPERFEVVNAPRGGAVTHRQFNIRRLSTALPCLSFTPFEAALAATVSAAAAPYSA